MALHDDPCQDWLHEAVPDMTSMGLFDLPPELLQSPNNTTYLPTKAIDCIPSSPQGRTIFMQTFALHLKLHNYPTGAHLNQDQKECLLRTVEQLSELTQSLSRSPSQPCLDVLLSCGNEVQTLLFLFITVLRAVTVSQGLLPTLDGTLVSPSSESTIEWPFDGLYHDATLPSHTDFGSLSSATNTEDGTSVVSDTWLSSFAEPQPIYHHNSQTLELTRLDIILYDLSLFSKTMAKLTADGDIQQRTANQLLVELHQQNEKCLSALKQLHGQVHAHLELIRPNWDGAHAADEDMAFLD